MKSVTEIRSLGDVRTNITTHARSAPRRKGAAYLEVYLLDRERARLETELTMLARRRGRIEPRLQEVRASLEHLVRKAQEEASAKSSPPASAPAEGPAAKARGCNAARVWTKLPIEY